MTKATWFILTLRVKYKTRDGTSTSGYVPYENIAIVNEKITFSTKVICNFCVMLLGTQNRNGKVIKNMINTGIRGAKKSWKTEQ